MKIQIDAETTISDVQKKFNEIYPYLKLDFYKKPHEESALSEVSDLIKTTELFSKIKSISEPISINVDPERTVAQVESEFYDKCGVAMQVSRRSGDIWIQTSKTDYRTLKLQNESGEAMSAMEGQ